jgi:hypothetical protein
MGLRQEPRTIEPRAAGSGEAGLAVDVEAQITRRPRTAKGEVRSRNDQESCDFCGRTLLVGESPHLFEEPDDGGTVMVCPICRREALELGLRSISRVA